MYQGAVRDADQARRVSDRIIERVSEREGTDSLELDEPLYRAIDPDALDALLRTSNEDLTVEFTYLGHRIVVQGDGRVVVRE